MPCRRAESPRDDGGRAAPSSASLHGGGFVMWRPEISDLRNRFIAGDLRCVVVSVDYRHPPETPFPGPIEDCYAALRWLHDTAGYSPGWTPARIAVQGESAGGGLAAALVLLRATARRSRSVPGARVPDARRPHGHRRRPAPERPHGRVRADARDTLASRGAAMLDREPGKATSPYCAPARAADLTRACRPRLIQVGSLDLVPRRGPRLCPTPDARRHSHRDPGDRRSSTAST